MESSKSELCGTFVTAMVPKDEAEVESLAARRPVGSRRLAAFLPGMTAALWAIALCTRVVVVGLFGADPLEGADLVYWRGAQNLIGMGIFSEFPAPSEVQTAVVPPGYAAFIASLTWIRGEPWLVVAAQILLSAFTVVPVRDVATLLWGRRGGIIAALTYAVAPLTAFLAGRIASETLFVSCFMWALALTVRASRKPASVRTFSAWIVGALLIGVSPIIRPIGVGLVLAWLPVALWTLRRRPALAALVAIVAVLPLGLWCARNVRAFGHPLPGGTNSYTVAGRYSAAWVVSRGDGVSMEVAREQIGELPPNPSPDEIRAFSSRTRQALLKHPGWWLRGLLQGLPITMLGLEPFGVGVGPTGRVSRSHGVRDLVVQGRLAEVWWRLAARRRKLSLGVNVWWAYTVLYSVLTTVLFTAGVWRALSNTMGGAQRIVVLLVCTWVLWLCAAPSPQTSSRFRMPVEPLVAMMIPGAVGRRDRRGRATVS